MSTWSILQPLKIFYDPFGIFSGHLVYFPRFGMLYREKSGNPGHASNFLGQADVFQSVIIPEKHVSIFGGGKKFWATS
jgi:hypothetical protein